MMLTGETAKSGAEGARRLPKLSGKRTVSGLTSGESVPLEPRHYGESLRLKDRDNGYDSIVSVLIILARTMYMEDISKLNIIGLR